MDTLYHAQGRNLGLQGKLDYILLVGAWFSAAYILLILTLILLIFSTNTKIIWPTSTDFRLYAALPANTSEISDIIEREDARAKIVEGFFKGYNSSLSKYGDLFVQVSDKYKLDYRLLPAIAMQESNGGKRVPKDSYNPFGYGIYGSLVIKFASWEEAIEVVGKALREDYLNEGLTTPERIMTKYTPPSTIKGGAWAKGVSSFLEELR